MEPWQAAALGVLVAALVATHPSWREQFGERYEDDREFFRSRRPRMWTFLDGMDRGEDAAPDHPDERVRCPACGAENRARFDRCGDCGTRLPPVNV